MSELKLELESLYYETMIAQILFMKILEIFNFSIDKRFYIYFLKNLMVNYKEIITIVYTRI